MRAGVLIVDGRFEEAIAILLEDPATQSHPLLALAYAPGGRAEDALKIIENAIEKPFPPEHRSLDAEKHRLKGEILLLQTPPDEDQAERCFRTAIEIARRQSADSWELGATMRLARLLDKQGRRDEARAMLCEIYRWFTEGFDTADLKDAKALLDELTQ